MPHVPGQLFLLSNIRKHLFNVFYLTKIVQTVAKSLSLVLKTHTEIYSFLGGLVLMFFEDNKIYTFGGTARQRITFFKGVTELH